MVIYFMEVRCKASEIYTKELEKTLAFSYDSKPLVITVDKNPAYPIAIKQLKDEKRCLKASE